jgi:hypothetical protein
MPGLIREARDMQGIKEQASRKQSDAKPAAAPGPGGEPPTERGPKKKG